MGVALRYVDLSEPGYTRRRRGTGWQYLKPSGSPIVSARLIERLNRLALPPAYEQAWFATDPAAHIQATGIDARGRKQYRYHPDFRARRDLAKYDGCEGFGAALPKLRERVEADLRRTNLDKDRVVAAIVRLLDIGHVRVGNESYAKANKSFGATTLRNRHAQAGREKVMLEYVGKSGKTHAISIADRRLARVVRRCQEVPGQLLFQYVDAEGQRHPVSSQDVNDYLRTHMGVFTAKHFRTWGASVIAFGALARAKGRIRLKEMLEEVAEKLGNTPAIARKSYVHPAIIDAVLEPIEGDWSLPRAARRLSREERGFLAFLDRKGGK